MNKSTGLLLLSGSDASAMDIKYLSKFTAPDQFMYLQTEAQGVLVVSSMEQNRAKQQSTPGTVVYTPAELGLKGKDLGDAAAWPIQGLIKHFRPEIERRIMAHQAVTNAAE